MIKKTHEEHLKRKRETRRNSPRQQASSKAYRKTEKNKQIDRDYAKRTGKAKRFYLINFNNRFKKMKEKDPTMVNMDDIALKYLAAELADPDTSKERKDQIAFKLLPFTSRAKPTEVLHSGEVNHTRTLISDKIDQMLLDDTSAIVSEQ